MFSIFVPEKQISSPKTQNMKLEIQTKTTIETTITPPLFWKSPSGYEWRALFSETDYREIAIIKDCVFVQKNDPQLKLKAIEEAFLEWPQITELEFITKMDEVLTTFSLTPTLKP